MPAHGPLWPAWVAHKPALMSTGFAIGGSRLPSVIVSASWPLKVQHRSRIVRQPRESSRSTPGSPPAECICQPGGEADAVRGLPQSVRRACCRRCMSTARPRRHGSRQTDGDQKRDEDFQATLQRQSDGRVRARPYPAQRRRMRKLLSQTAYLPDGRPGPRALPLDLALALGGGAALDVVPLVQHPLQPGDRLGRVGGDLRRPAPAPLLGRRGRRDAVDEAQAQRLVGADRARGEQQVLGGGEAAERDQAGRADRDAERGAGEAHAQVGAADPHVAGDRDLGAAADHVAVAGGDRRLGEGDDLRRRGRRRAACGAPCPPRRAPP